MSVMASEKVVQVLALGLVTACSNLFFIEPAATATLFERYAAENAPKKDADLIKKLLYKFGAYMRPRSLGCPSAPAALSRAQQPYPKQIRETSAWRIALGRLALANVALLLQDKSLGLQ